MQHQAARLMRHPTRDFHDVILYDQNGLLTPWGFGYHGTIVIYTQDESQWWRTRLCEANKIYMEWDEADEYATQTTTEWRHNWYIYHGKLVVIVDECIPREALLVFAALRHKHELRKVELLASKLEQLDLELVGRLGVTHCVLRRVWPLDTKSLCNITHMELSDMHVFPGLKSLATLKRLVLTDAHFGAFELRGLKLDELLVHRSSVCLHTLLFVLADMTSLKELCIKDTHKDEDSYVQASSLAMLVTVTDLEYLELENNLLSGSLPRELAMLTKLECLYVEEDQDNQRFDRRVCQEILDMKLATLCIF